MKRTAFALAIAAALLSASAAAAETPAAAPPAAPATQWSLVLAMGNNTFIIGGYSSEAKCTTAKKVTGASMKKEKLRGSVHCLELLNAT